MAKRIQISSNNPDLGILTYRGLKSELDQTIPENWVRFFIGRNEDDILPDYNRIQYLRNVNIRPFVTDKTSACMPIWHAAVVLLNDNVPTRLLLVSETKVLDELVQRYPPIMIIGRDYPAAEVSLIKAELDDAEEKPEQPESNQFADYRLYVYKGLPSEKQYKHYLSIKKQAEQIAAAMGYSSTVALDYRMSTNKFEMNLHFEYCMVTDKIMLLIMNDAVIPEEAW